MFEVCRKVFRNVHTESSGVFSSCYKIFLGVLKVVTKNIFFSNMIKSVDDTNSEEQELLMDQERGKL